MTAPERRTKLKANATMKALWYVILVLQGVGIGIIIVAVAAFFFVAGHIGVLNGATGAVVGVASIFLIAYLGLMVFFWFSMFALAKWMRILLWVNVALSIFSGGKYFGFLIALFIAIAYMYILKAVDSATTPTPPVAPIAK